MYKSKRTSKQNGRIAYIILKLDNKIKQRNIFIIRHIDRRMDFPRDQKNKNTHFIRLTYYTLLYVIIDDTDRTVWLL